MRPPHEHVLERAAAGVQAIEREAVAVGPFEQQGEVGLQRVRLQHVLADAAVGAQGRKSGGSGTAGARKAIRAGSCADTSPRLPATAIRPSRMIAMRFASASASSR